MSRKKLPPEEKEKRAREAYQKRKLWNDTFQPLVPIRMTRRNGLHKYLIMKSREMKVSVEKYIMSALGKEFTDYTAKFQQDYDKYDKKDNV